MCPGLQKTSEMPFKVKLSKLTILCWPAKHCVTFEDLLEKLFDGLEGFLNILSKAKDSKQIGAAAQTLNDELGVIREKQLPKIASKTVFIADDIEDFEPQSVEDIGEDLGETETIVTVSGVRG